MSKKKKADLRLRRGNGVEAGVVKDFVMMTRIMMRQLTRKMKDGL